eukprot:3556117-Amphidinium_carterae.2
MEALSEGIICIKASLGYLDHFLQQSFPISCKDLTHRNAQERPQGHSQQLLHDLLANGFSDRPNALKALTPQPEVEGQRPDHNATFKTCGSSPTRNLVRSLCQ